MASGVRSVPVYATVPVLQPPAPQPRGALTVPPVSQGATATKTKTNVSTTRVGPMPTVPTQLVLSAVTVMPATSNTTSPHASVRHWLIHDFLVILFKRSVFFYNIQFQ